MNVLKYGLCLGLIFTAILCQDVFAQDRPNVLLIAIDDLRPELGCYGSAVAVTPSLDKLASEGLLFERAYCNYPICGASRASLLSGLYPTSKRFLGLAPLDQYEPDAVTLPQVFKQNGYTTISNGKIFHRPDDANERSWSEPAWRPKVSTMASLDPATRRQLSKKKRGYITEGPDVADNAYFDGMVAEKTIADLRKLKEAGKPFFLACGFVKPHLPFYAPKKYWDLYDRDKLPLASNRYRPKDAPAELKGSGEYNGYFLGDLEVNSDEWHREMLHGYLACTSYADALAGQVLDELDRLGLADNTIVVVWGDHGFHLGEHNFWGKHNTLHHALRVPLIVRVPDSLVAESIAKGNRTDALVESVDLYPTLCDLAGVTPPETIQGRSFRALLANPGSAFRDSIYARFNTADTIVTPRYAYTRFGGKDGARMLFDHRVDEQENQNVVEQPDYGVAVRELDKYLDQRIAQAEGRGDQNAEQYAPSVPKPTLAEVRYGPHERNVLDFWQAAGEGPRPAVIVIHGGGWKTGSKERVDRFADVPALLEAGVSVIAIDYRFIMHGVTAGLEPPVQAPLHDAARALQFVRTQATQWKIDPERIGLAGGSAGACSSLWLAFHDDMADLDSDDPVLRESTKPYCAAVIGAQTSMDPAQMKAWTPNSRYGAHAFGFGSFAAWLEARDDIAPWISEYSPYALVSSDDPPIYLAYSDKPGIGQPQKDPTHTSNFGVKLQERCVKLGVACELVYPDAPGVQHETTTAFLISTLKGTGQSAKREAFDVDGHNAFILVPSKAAKPEAGKPWVWYAPTLGKRLPGKEEQWMFDRLHAKGIAIAGIDVGESYGSPKGREAFQALYNEMTEKRGYSKRPVLLARSRGGLMLYNWAVEHPKAVGGIAGIYPVCNLLSYPGLDKAAPAYEMSAAELRERLADHNPIDRLSTLAEANVPIFHLHGDSDLVVPHDQNTALLATRYKALGGTIVVELVNGQGHNLWRGWFESEALTDFMIERSLNQAK